MYIPPMKGPYNLIIGQHTFGSISMYTRMSPLCRSRGIFTTNFLLNFHVGNITHYVKRNHMIPRCIRAQYKGFCA